MAALSRVAAVLAVVLVPLVLVLVVLLPLLSILEGRERNNVQCLCLIIQTEAVLMVSL